MSRHMNAEFVAAYLEARRRISGESVSVYLEATEILALIGPDPEADRHVRDLRDELGISCRLDGCDADSAAQSLCQNHYRRHLRATRNEARTINRKASNV